MHLNIRSNFLFFSITSLVIHLLILLALDKTVKQSRIDNIILKVSTIHTYFSKSNKQVAKNNEILPVKKNIKSQEINKTQSNEINENNQIHKKVKNNIIDKNIQSTNKSHKKSLKEKKTIQKKHNKYYYKTKKYCTTYKFKKY